MLNLMILVGISACIYIFGTALVSRLAFGKKISVYFRIAFLGIFTVPVIWFLRLSLSGELLNFLFYDAVTHLSLGVLFAHFICLPDRALTLRILVEIYETGEKGLSLQELNARFSLAQMIKSRLVQMEKGQLLQISQKGEITLLSKGLNMGKFILAGRKFFNISSAN